MDRLALCTLQLSWGRGAWNICHDRTHMTKAFCSCWKPQANCCGVGNIALCRSHQFLS